MPEPLEDAFGFADVRREAAAKLLTIKPSAPPPVPVDTAAADAAAARKGFISRDATTATPVVDMASPVSTVSPAPITEMPQIVAEPIATYIPTQQVKPAKEPFEQIAFRMPFSKKQLFQAWCDENRYTYSEGLIYMMKQLGLLK